MRLYSPEPSSGACPKADQQQHLPKPKKIPSYFSVCISYFLISFFFFLYLLGLPLKSIFTTDNSQSFAIFRLSLFFKFLIYIAKYGKDVTCRHLGLPRPNGLIIYDTAPLIRNYFAHSAVAVLKPPCLAPNTPLMIREVPVFFLCLVAFCVAQGWEGPI